MCLHLVRRAWRSSPLLAWAALGMGFAKIPFICCCRLACQLGSSVSCSCHPLCVLGCCMLRSARQSRCAAHSACDCFRWRNSCLRSLLTAFHARRAGSLGGACWANLRCRVSVPLSRKVSALPPGTVTAFAKEQRVRCGSSPLDGGILSSMSVWWGGRSLRGPHVLLLAPPPLRKPSRGPMMLCLCMPPPCLGQVSPLWLPHSRGALASLLGCMGGTWVWGGPAVGVWCLGKAATPVSLPLVRCMRNTQACRLGTRGARKVSLASIPSTTTLPCSASPHLCRMVLFVGLLRGVGYGRRALVCGCVG